MSKSASETTTATSQETTSTRPAMTKKSKTEDIKLELTNFWSKELFRREVAFRDETIKLDAARTKLEEADKAYREALRLQNYHLHESLSLFMDAVLERLPLAERRFLIKEITSIARYWSGQGDIVISRAALMKFIESLVFHCM